MSEASEHSGGASGLGAVVLATRPAPATDEAARVPWRGEPPVRAAARAAVEAGLWPVVVVIARDADEARSAVAGLPVATALDDDPRPDLSTGVRLGLARLRECAPQLRGLAILDGAAPPGGGAGFSALLAAFTSGHRPIAACERGGAPGLPAIFSAEVLPELLALAPGEELADLLLRDPARVTRSPGAGRG